MSLLARLLLLVAIAVSPAIVIQAHNELDLRREREAAARDETMRLLGLFETEQSRIVEGIRQLLITVSVSEALRQHPRECQAMLDKLAPKMPRYQVLAVTDSAGAIICSTEEASVGITIGDRPHFEAARRSGDFQVGQFVIRRGTGDAVLPFSHPYHDASGQFLGIVTLSLNLGWLEDFLSRKSLPPNTRVTIADRDGVILARHPDDLYAIGSPLPPHLIQLVHGDRPGLAEVVNQVSSPRLVAYSPVESGTNQVFIALSFDKQSIFSPVSAAAQRGIALMVVTLLAGLAAAALFYRSLLGHPLSRLTSAVEAWRIGDLDARTGLRGGTELERLGGAFDEMAEAIKDRERVREQARSAERRTTQVLASTTDGVFEIGHDWTILYMNARARTILAEGADLTGKNLWEAFPDARDSRFFAEYSRAMRERRAVDFEESYGPLGGIFWARAFPTDLGLAVYFQDVTARRQAEAELQEARGWLEAMFNHAPLGFAFFDRGHRLVGFNKRLAELDGRANEAQVGAPLAKVLPNRAAVVAGLIDQVFETGAPAQSVLAESKTATSPARHWLVSFYPVSAGSENRWVGAVALDVSERARAEQELRAAMELAEQADRDKGRFLAAASHDLRQPVQSLMLFTSALSSQLAGHPAESIVRFIEKSTEALKQLLDSLLDMSRLDAGLVVPTLTDFDAADLVVQLADQYRVQAEDKGLRLELVAHPAHVSSDRTLVERILRNLIENAVRYTPEGLVRIASEPTPGGVRVTVSDTGCGIPQEQLGAIFREFYQLHNPERDRSQGLGLGLSIVRRLAHLLELRMGVDSTEGQGSRFWIELPLAVAATTAEAAEPPSQQAALRILVIDDEEMIRTGLSLQLRDWGHGVETAGDEVEAVERASASIDLILADYRLRGGVTGLDAIERVRQAVGHAVPAVILTGDTAPARIAEVQASGHMLLHKPVSPAALQAAIAICGRQTINQGWPAAKKT